MLLTRKDDGSATLVNWDNVLDVQNVGDGSLIWFVGRVVHVVETVGEIRNQVSIWRNGR